MTLHDVEIQPTGSTKPEIFETMQDIIEENPKAKASKIQRLFADTILHDEDLCRAFVETFTLNVYSMVMRKGIKRKRRTKEQKQEATGKYLHRFVLKFTMPNGKPLGECSFAECGKFGGQFSKLAIMGKPDEIVGQVLTQKQVRKVLFD